MMRINIASPSTSNLEVTWEHWTSEIHDAASFIATDPTLDRKNFDHIAEQIDLCDIHDWYAITSTRLANFTYGDVVLRKYSSMYDAMKNVYPNTTWHHWLFQVKNKKHWEDSTTHSEYLHWLSEQLEISHPSDWFTTASINSFAMTGGSTLLQMYDNLPSKLLEHVYPDVNWQHWKYDKAHKSFWENTDNLREYMQWLAEQLNVQHIDDWYKVKHSIVVGLGGASALQHYEGQLGLALQELFPEYDWQLWRMSSSRLPSGYWNHLETQRKFFAWIAKDMQLEHLADWYLLKKTDVYERGGAELLQLYDNVVIDAVHASCANELWQLWISGEVGPKGFWKSRTMQRYYFDWLAEKLDMDSIERWYSLKQADILHRNGAGILEQIDSLPSSLQSVYPNTEWQLWRFDSKPQSVWSQELQQQYMEWLSHQLNILHYVDWYRVRKVDIMEHFGEVILKMHDGSVDQVLREVYPHVAWQSWLFGHMSLVHWNDLDCQQDYFQWLADQLHIETIDDWYTVTESDIAMYKGSELLQHFYHGSQFKALTTLYPDVQWYPWLSHNLSMEYLNNTPNQRQCLEWVEEQLVVEEIEDWYLVTELEFKYRGGESLLSCYDNSLFTALLTLYPDTEWHPWRFSNFETFQGEYWENIYAHGIYFDWLARKLDYITAYDWYRVSPTECANNHGGYLLKTYYSDSCYEALQRVYPQVTWYPWLFHTAPTGFWDNPVHHRQYFDWLAEQLDISTVSMWYRVKTSQVLNRVGTELLQHYYNMSQYKALTIVYRDTEWHEWMFVGEEFWNSVENQRKYFDWFASVMNIKGVEDWYMVADADILDMGGAELLQKFYGGNIFKALVAVYPELPWHPYLVDHSSSYWKDVDNQRSCLNWLKGQLNVVEPDDWYKVSVGDLSKRGGHRLLSQYGGHLSLALMRAYPEELWYPWKFSQLPPGYWDVLENHKFYFHWLAEQVHINHVDDWYQVNRSFLLKNGLENVAQYQYSPREALSMVFPDTEWQYWKFTPLPPAFWDDPQNRKQQLDYLEDKLEITSPEDWYGYTLNQVIALGGVALTDYSGGLFNMIKNHYPQYEWDEQRWKAHTGSKSQMFFFNTVKSLFPADLDIESNHTSQFIRYKSTANNMQLDVWIPELNLGMEYQGAQHYKPNNFWVGGFDWQITRDVDKQEACTDTAIKLISIPHWWDLQSSSLAALIHKYFPFILRECGDMPIPEHFPYKPKSNEKYFSFNGSIFTPAFPQPWTASVDPTGWWACKKYNGVRIFSDGKGNFFVEDGKRLFPPNCVVTALRGPPLEIVLREDEYSTKRWNQCRIYIVDAPSLPGNVDQRCQQAKKLLDWHAIGILFPNVEVAEHWQVPSLTYLLQWMRDHMGKCNALFLKANYPEYIEGLSYAFMKVKILQVVEAVIVAYDLQKQMLQVRLRDSDEEHWLHSVKNKSKYMTFGAVGSSVSVVYYDINKKTGTLVSPRLLEE